jgi:hypothetical protein
MDYRYKTEYNLQDVANNGLAVDKYLVVDQKLQPHPQSIVRRNSWESCFTENLAKIIPQYNAAGYNRKCLAKLQSRCIYISYWVISTYYEIN